MNKKIFRLPKPSENVNIFGTEDHTKSPLYKYNKVKVQEYRQYSLLKQNAAQSKIRLCSKVKPDPDIRDEAIPRPLCFYIERIKRNVEEAPILKITKKTRELTMKFTIKRLVQKYPNIVNNYLKDVDINYETVIKSFTMKTIMQCSDANENEEFHFQRLGKTNRFRIYLKNRKRIDENLMITHPFVRRILHYSITEFPQILNDFRKYRRDEKGNLNILTLEEFETMISEDLESNSVFIRRDWYPKVIKLFKHSYSRRLITIKNVNAIMNCAAGLINRQITDLKIRTFNQIFEVIRNRDTPIFALESMAINDTIMLFPGIRDIFSTFKRIFNQIKIIAKNLPHLSSQLSKDAAYKILKIHVEDNFMNVIYSKLQDSVDQLYAPLLQFIDDFTNEYSAIYSYDTYLENENFLSEPRTIDEYVVKIDFTNNFLAMLRNRNRMAFFEITFVDQTKSIKRLERIARSFLINIAEAIAFKYTSSSAEICQRFEDITSRVLETPTSTEQLLANGEYMTYVKTKEMFELRDEIQENLKICGILVELVEEPDPTHSEIQIGTIRMYNNMPAIFDQAASLFENYKFKFEEHVQYVKKKLINDTELLIPNLCVINDMCDIDKFKKYKRELRVYIDQLICFEDYVKWINNEEVLFKFPISTYPILTEIGDFILPFSDLMQKCINWVRYYYVWMDGPFEYLEPRFVEDTTENSYKEFLRIQKSFRNKIKQDMAKITPCKFRGQTEDPDPEKHPVPLKLCIKMLKWINEFRYGVHLVNIMCNSALRPRHWEEMSLLAGFDITPDYGTTLRKIINFNIESKVNGFEIISVCACKELELQVNLAAMKAEWETIMFPFTNYKNTNITVLSSLDDIQAILDDHIIKVLGMRGSSFVKPCEAEVISWYNSLTCVNETFEQWGRVQASWLYLLPIFSSNDIVAQMPQEGALFAQVDQIYRQNMEMAVQNPKVISMAATPAILESLILSNGMLDDITNGVNIYLEQKRLYFPRFFFLSNDEIFEILSETKNPRRVQPHISKCFEGIQSLEFDDSQNIHAMLSAEMERIGFVDPIITADARGSVEKWLLQVEGQMFAAVRQECENGYADFPNHDRCAWTLLWPQMVILCISQVYWASDVHSCLAHDNPSTLDELLIRLKADINEIVAAIRSETISNINRITIKSLIVIDVHAKDIVDDLHKNNIQSVDDFQWLAQLRYYWEGNIALVRIVNATIAYANEYLGNSDRLVITPLTDRCYRTLVGAYQLHLNGAPEGPAGTGKTETTKDLAKALAIECKVFNCSDSLDYKAMGNFFKGLASSGVWACFDEFNRIETEVLSVIAQQIHSIIVAIRANLKVFLFEGTQLNLKPTCYVCITMNPGYAGRSDLPDNLKVLFRTVAMMVPDYAMIGEISLYSFGFINARSLAIKMVTTYRLCSELLSNQNHYDYGMRAVKTVLQACGNKKQVEPNENEEILLLRSLIDVNMPKFLSFDIPLFEGLIMDLFPGIELSPMEYKDVHDAFVVACKKFNLQPIEGPFTKFIQTLEMMIIRHGFMMVGEPYAGKSSTLKVLAAALGNLATTTNNIFYKNCQMGIINPKSITIGQLYGSFDPISYEWTDGIASTIFRGFAMDTSLDRKWLIFDGPVDAVWIENMNSVLDDNKKLCLISGEVITMNSTMSVIFEVMDLFHASPATVSRCGMIYMEPYSIGWQAFAKSWIDQCNPLWVTDWKDFVIRLLEWIIPPVTTFLTEHCSLLLKPGYFNLLHTTLSIFEMVINDAINDNLEEYQKFLFNWLQAAMVYSVVWGIGGLLNTASREKFDTFYKQMWINPDITLDSDGQKLDISIPNEGNMYEYVYIYKQKGSWKHWFDLVRRLEPDIGPLGIQVSTIDTGRYLHILELHVKNNRKLLLVGPTGTGKSFYVQNYLLKLNKDDYLTGFITLTVMTTANQLQELVISKLTKKKRDVYGTSGGKKCVLFLDDMNMPVKEVYGAQPPLELLRQYIDYSSIYDMKSTRKIQIENVLLLSACGLPGGSRQDVYQRFLSHFNCFAINDFTEDTLVRIFTNVLMYGFKKGGHNTDVLMNVNQIVRGTISTFNKVCNELRATPLKSHYIFNLRDVSRICLGCSLLKKDSVTSKQMFARIWFHESLRMFYDRMIDVTDRTCIFEILSDALHRSFGERINKTFEDYVDENGTVSMIDLNNFMFGSYLDLDSEPDSRKYEEIPSLDTLKKIALDNIKEYNATHKNRLDIVLFSDALQHLNKICRVILMPSGSSVLVGIDGSGRQSLTKLAATICQQSLIQPEITKNYGKNEWTDDLKNILKESGGYGKDLVFLFTENQIKHEEFLTDIDCLLNLGEVPNIWPIDEKQEILELVRLAAQGGNRNLEISPLEVFSFFVNRCKQNLHIILCFSPMGSAFRTRIRLYPSLVNCCTIDWYDPWPEDALTMVAEMYIACEMDEELKRSCITACKQFHVDAQDLSREFLQATGRKTYVTSVLYLELLKSYQKLLTLKQSDTKFNQNRYICGLNTLHVAAMSVSVMQKELNDLQPQLFIMAEKSKTMAKEIEQKTIEASVATEQVKKDEIVANIQAASAEEMENECSKDLAQAVPVLEEALQALNTLKPADITLVKSMKNPPSVVKLVMAAVCVMKGIQPDRVNDPATGKKVMDYWGPSKKILGDMGFLQALKDYDKDNISEEIMKKIRKEFIPNKDFQPQIVAKASSAAEGLCKWIIAMDLYDAVAKVVAPKKAKLYAAKELLKETKLFLAQKRELAAELEAKVAKLNQDLEDANNARLKTEGDVELCIKKLERAEALISGLGKEGERWKIATAQLQNVYDHLPGDILISCGIIAYLAPFTMNYRTTCIENWYRICKELKIPCTDPFNFTLTMESDATVQNWILKGLPFDPFSVDNAVISKSSSRYTLFIDPQGQANKWLKTMEKENKLQVIRLSQSDFVKVLEKSIEYGIPVLIENVGEELEPALNPILLRNTFIQSGVEYLSIGDNTIPMSPLFNLYLTTNLRNPHFLPDVFNKLTIVNFALTHVGLEDQLLGIVVGKENPILQELREKIILENAQNKATLKGTEDQILAILSNSESDILENESAIGVLDNAKLLAADILIKQAKGLETEIQIEAFRKDYKPIAFHATNLYYCLINLSDINPMYQFSLKWFINLYIYSIEMANKNKDVQKRLQFLKQTLTENFYNTVCRSIFERDKLLFSFLMTTELMMANEQIDVITFMFLINPNAVNKIDVQNPSPDWIDSKMWEQICMVENLPALNRFAVSFKDNLSEWKRYYDHTESERLSLPGDWDTTIGCLEKLIVLRSIRPDRLLFAIKDFVSNQMGAAYVTPPQFDIAKSFSDSNCLMPLIFVLSPGADPMGALLLYAKKVGFDTTFRALSLGQGQGPLASKMISDAQQEGSWVCLQNCHLAASWMPSLAKIWENMDVFNTAPAFRLWLTSYPSEKFPTSVLQNSVKMTNEPPTGLQQNLLRSYLSEPVNDSLFYEGCSANDRAFTRLLYGLCFFHAVIQERRKFGPLGWNILYDFNESDFQICVHQLQMLLNQYAECPYDAICYLTGECNYGGRVTDVWDRSKIATILKDYINDRVVNNPDHQFYSKDAYILPSNFDYREIVKHIQKMIPNNPEPEIYGLHSNAGIIRDLNLSEQLVKSLILGIGGVSSSSGGDSNKNLLIVVNDIKDRLPINFNIEICKEKYPFDYNESMNTILVQEMQRFNKLLDEIRNTCIEVEKACHGLIVTTPQLEDVFNAITFRKVPSNWMKKSYVSLKPIGPYIRNFLERLNWLSEWADKGKPPTFWLSGFFFSHAFLTGVMQNHARRYKLPIHIITFDFNVLKVKNDTKSPADGVYVHGLFIEGGRWNWERSYIVEQKPKILIEEVPLIHFIPTLVGDLDERGRYKCPVYSTSERKGTLSTTGHSTNYILPVYLSTVEPTSHWVKRSVALICQTDN